MCSDNHLPPFSVFPVTSRPHIDREIQFANHGIEPLRELKTWNFEMDMVHAIIESNGCEEPNSVMDEALDNCVEYKTWQKKMPYLRDVPSIQKYRNNIISNCSLSEVDKEILRFGEILPSGQILYRGAIFDGNDIENTYYPISTSTHPRVAWWHAKEVSGSIALIKVAEASEIRAFAFKTTGNQNHTAEYEILLQGNLRLKCKDTHSHNDMRILEYEASNA